MEADLARPFQVQVGRPDSEGFTDPRAGIVKKQQQGMVAHALRRAAIRLGQQHADFFGLQVAGGGGALPLGGERQDPLILLGAGRIAAKQVSKKRPQGRQAAVARTSSIAASLLQMTEERHDPIRLQILWAKMRDGSPPGSGR